MNAKKGFTRVDAAVALACVALILAQAGVINAGLGRERAKRDVCLANLRSLAAAWQTYAGDNSGKIPSGDVGYSWAFPASAGGPQRAWVEWLHTYPHVMPPSSATNWGGGPGTGPSLSYSSAINAPDSVKQHAISEGLLWKYVGDYNIYHCLASSRGTYVSYAMSISMNCYPGAAGSGAVTFTNINQITKPAERYAFLDVGNIKAGGFFVAYNTNPSAGRWYDMPPRQHDMGTTFVFADGHAIYRKWTDPHTVNAINDWGGGPIDLCDCDLRWMTKVTWGNVVYPCTDPAKNCEY